jgi:hypothetical protein
VPPPLRVDDEVQPGEVLVVPLGGEHGTDRHHATVVDAHVVLPWLQVPAVTDAALQPADRRRVDPWGVDSVGGVLDGDSSRHQGEVVRVELHDVHAGQRDPEGP